MSAPGAAEARVDGAGTAARGARRARWTDLRAAVAARAVPVAIGAFVAGVLVGWMVLGWWVAPVEWVDALPVDLVPAEREAYVQMVADLYVRDDRLQRAVERLASFRAVGDDARLAELLGRLTEPGRDAASAENVRRLAGAIGVAPRAPATPTEAEGGGLVAGTGANLGRGLAILVLLAAVAGGVYLARGWSAGRRDGDADAPRPAAGPARGRADESAAVDPGAAHGAASVLYAERPPGYAPPERPFEHTQPLELPESLTRGRQPAPQWRPGRIDLGVRTVAEFDGSDEPFYLSWLLYDEQASLVGAAALKAVRIGSVTTLDLWFYERDETSDVVERPTITLVSRAAAREPVLRARLGDRRLLEVAPGAVATLAAGDLELDVAVIDSASPESDGLSLPRLRIGLTARRAVARPEDDEPDPPVPLPFRR